MGYELQRQMRLDFSRGSRSSTIGARYTSVEVCAGAGGQAIGIERAGFDHLALVELEPFACKTLRANRPRWNVIEADLNGFDPADYVGIDLLAGGLPCPPFSVAGKQLGALDERNLFPAFLRLVRQTHPRAVMIENVHGFLDPRFTSYRQGLRESLEEMGYWVDWSLLNAAEFGVPQVRQRVVIVALKQDIGPEFEWPLPSATGHVSAGEALYQEMARGGWEGAMAWKSLANAPDPTLVGGSKKHGGPDLGPTRAREAWAKLGVDGRGIADAPPGQNFSGMPRLTIPMAAILQGFPPEWKFEGGKTSAYRQIGNAFPCGVAYAVASSIRNAFDACTRREGEPALAHAIG